MAPNVAVSERALLPSATAFGLDPMPLLSEKSPLETMYLIAPNAYVNFSVPDHSIVLGNPAVIKHRSWATKDYIINFTYPG